MVGFATGQPQDDLTRELLSAAPKWEVSGEPDELAWKMIRQSLAMVARTHANLDTSIDFETELKRLIAKFLCGMNPKNT